MRNFRKFAPLTAFLLVFALYFNQLPATTEACGPEYVSPVFTYSSTPDVPFDGYLDGKLGIIKPGFGVKLLALAYRQGNGTSFSADEKRDIKLALKGLPPETDGEELIEAVKKWIKTREKIAGKSDADIYTERPYNGYNFFPNCAKNAFETATATLESRALSNGSDDANVREWIRGQDVVFENCGATSQSLSDAPSNAPEWLKKDRVYQIAATKFYSLDNDGAIADFRRIAADSDSVWRETADYLVLRTMVRRASLEDKEKQIASFAEAEEYAQSLLGRTSKFYGATLRLLGLIRYRTKPRERFEELSRSVATSSASENLRQDLIDYQWLYDKFLGEAFEAEAKRLEEEQKEKQAQYSGGNSNVVVSQTMGNAANAMANAANVMGNAANSTAYTVAANAVAMPSYISDRDEATKEKPVLVSFYVYENDVSKSYAVAISPETSEAETLDLLEAKMQRKLTDEERKQVAESRKYSISDYKISISNNSKVGSIGEQHTESYGELKESIVPENFRNDEMTDWITNFQISGDVNAFAYAVKKFGDTRDELWLASALVKADENSADIENLLNKGLAVSRDSILFPTVFYNVIRIKIEQKKIAEARKMLDGRIFNDIFTSLPISTQNEFAELRLKTAANLSEFLNYAKRRPSTFNYIGSYGSIDEFINEYDKQKYTDEQGKILKGEDVYANERIWQGRLMFDSDSISTMNLYLPLKTLTAIIKGDELPDYLRGQMLEAAWTRALLLNDAPVIGELAPLMIERKAAMKPTIEAILQAQTPIARQDAITYHLLKFPSLTPAMDSGMGKTDDFSEPDSWSLNWWCSSTFTEYDENYNPQPLSARNAPSFLNPLETKQAVAEANKMSQLPDGTTFLTQRVFGLAKRNPKDVRLPEMLYVVVAVNGWSKYGCYVENAEEYRNEARRILKTRFPRSSWTAKAEKVVGDN